jgi:thiamine pyrophosphate-dependent acetolactate synthase large subunit-like protein
MGTKRADAAVGRETHTESIRPVSKGTAMPASPAAPRTTVSAHVANALAAHVDHVFGVMGNGNAWFLDAIERQTGASFTAVRHEAGGVVAADAHYRASNRLAAATSTYGAGFTNTLTSLAEAAQARVPLVLVVGDEPTSGPRPWDVDQIALASAVGARTYTVGRTDASATTVIAIEHALQYRLPVVLAIPYDVAAADAGPLPEAAALPQPKLPAPVAPTGDFAAGVVAEIAAALATAKRPFLLAGRGAWLAGAGEALGELAAATGAVTASTALGRGVFPEARYDLGVTGGFGAEGAMELVREADVAVVFGASLNQFTMRFGELFAPGTRVFQVDVASTATHPAVGGFVRGDAAVVARLLVDELDARGAESSGWRESLELAPLRAYPTAERPDGLADDGRLDPRAVAARIAELLPDDRVVVSDGGHFIGWANMYWPVASPDRMMMVGTAFQSIGQGFPSVAGAAAARPESTIVLTSGDGGGLMAIADLETAVRTARGRGVAVIWNDAAYGAEVNLYGLKGLAEAPMLIPQVDFAAAARAFGAEGVAVRELADLDALAAWAGRPADERPFLLLDCRISGRVIAPYQHEIIRINS